MKHFTLGLKNNDLGKYYEDIKLLSKGIKNLPSNLEHLALYLSENNLRKNYTE